MKIAFIMDDEAWFWIYNEDTRTWEAWYENADLTAHRISKMDRPSLALVLEMVTHLRLQASTAYVGPLPAY